MTISLPERPLGRKETYLAKAAGQDVTIPEPLGREEMYLAAIAEGGGGTDDYNELINQPKINSVTLIGNKSASDLGLAGLEGNTFTQTQKVNSAAYAGMKLQDGSDPTNIFTDFGKTGMYISDGDGVVTLAYKNIANKTELGGKEDTSNKVTSMSASSTDTQYPSAKAVYDKDANLQTQITNLQNIGRFLAIWNATTGVPTSEPTVQPYNYRTGDYYRVGTAGTRIPTGSGYVIGGVNYVVGDECAIGDIFYYDGSTWNKQVSTGGPNVVQSTGTSTTDVMSQNAATKMIFVKPNNASTTSGIKIGSTDASYVDYVNDKDIAIGQRINSATKTWGCGIVIGSDCYASSDGVVIGKNAGPRGYTRSNNSICIGFSATLPNPGIRSIVIGDTVTAGGGGRQVVIGHNATITGIHDGAIAIGGYSGSGITAAGMMDIGTSDTTYGYSTSNYRLLTGLYDGQNAHDAATVAQALGDTETYTITTSDWTALASATPYTYSATVTATHTIGNNTIVELYNDNPVLFATNGFAVGSVSGQSVVLYSISIPSASVSLKVNYKG